MKHHSNQDQLKKIGNHYRVEMFYAFGSRCQEVVSYLKKRGEMDKKSLSDDDIGVKIYRGSSLSVREKGKIIVELEDFFQVGRIDLVVLDEVDPFLAANVIRGERLFCVNENKADEYELYVLRRAGDLAPLEQERLSLIMEEP